MEPQELLQSWRDKAFGQQEFWSLLVRCQSQAMRSHTAATAGVLKEYIWRIQDGNSETAADLLSSMN
jgi:hypothetical protein